MSLHSVLPSAHGLQALRLGATASDEFSPKLPLLPLQFHRCATQHKHHQSGSAWLRVRKGGLGRWLRSALLEEAAEFLIDGANVVDEPIHEKRVQFPAQAGAESILFEGGGQLL
ncbi:MAG: hypothetical protein HN904_06720 [Victivallales bacterium]|nr:hypothetical protein [Victivallales bacterium]